ncbi:translation initiation factor IF-2-like [Lacerta agilis]|uniref:translation initiation factor IF-2-like n=1 Tax=Lacerta agilis TaxID=80427 RepID=UPI0014196958|nr:translation initiation factor IF-2-like [Lacerta agilis]
MSHQRPEEEGESPDPDLAVAATAAAPPEKRKGAFAAKSLSPGPPTAAGPLPGAHATSWAEKGTEEAAAPRAPLAPSSCRRSSSSSSSSCCCCCFSSGLRERRRLPGPPLCSLPHRRPSSPPWAPAGSKESRSMVATCRFGGARPRRRLGSFFAHPQRLLQDLKIAVCVTVSRVVFKLMELEEI